MKKKGFTLIELLAVIVILAIIALITIPLIGNVIEKAKIGALENSVNGLVESANMYYANQSIKGEQMTETIFDFANGEQTSTSKLSYKGKVYNGKLILHANGEVAVCIDDKEHYAYKNKDTDEIVSGIGTCLYDGTTGDFSSNSPVEDLKKQVAAATATADKVLEGSTIYTLSGLVAGTMANNANKTLSSTKVTESDDQENALITIPSSGYYDETSQISVPVETIKKNVSGVSDSLNHTNINGQSVAIYFEKNLDSIFLPKINSISMNTGDQVNNTFNVKPSISYNKDTGLLSYSNTYYQVSAMKYSFNIDVIQASSAIKMGSTSTSNGTINCTSLANYKNLTADNFILVLDNLYFYTGYWQSVAMTITPTFTYNSNTGIITVGSLYTNAGEASAKVGNATATVSAYYIEK